MADKNNTLPEPILREEKYLNAIANNTAGAGAKVVVTDKTITTNGIYNAVDDNVTAYNPVTVNVPNTYVAADEGKVVSNSELVAQTSTTATTNGTLNTTTNNEVVVNVANSYTAEDEGKVVSSGALVAQTSATYTTNNTYDTTLVNSVTVNVPSSSADLINLIERDITTFDIPSGTTKIGDYAFYNCSALTSVTIPSTVTTIGSNAFSACGLTSITIPSSVTIFNGGIFVNNRQLVSAVFEQGCTEIPINMFNGCSALTSVTIPNTLTQIKDYAFRYCTGLTSITIPSSVTSIASGGWSNAFDSCTNLTSITINKPEGSISGAPWGATNATVTWTG